MHDPDTTCRVLAGTLASAAGGACTGACRRGIRVPAHTGAVARTRARHVLVCNPTCSRAQRLYRRQGHSHQPLRSLRQASEPATPPACSRPRAARCSARVGLASSSLAQLRTCRVCVDRRSAWSGPGWWAAWAALCSTRCWARPCRQPTTTRRAAWWSGGPHPRWRPLSPHSPHAPHSPPSPGCHLFTPSLCLCPSPLPLHLDSDRLAPPRTTASPPLRQGATCGGAAAPLQRDGQLCLDRRRRRRRRLRAAAAARLARAGVAEAGGRGQSQGSGALSQSRARRTTGEEGGAAGGLISHTLGFCVH